MTSMTGSLPYRMTHWTMVVLTLANLLWVSSPSCCCASSNSCTKTSTAASADGTASCCSPKSDAAGCSCCCKKAAKHPADSCEHCAAKSNLTSTANTRSCNCGEVSSRPTAPVTRTTQTVQDHSEAAPLAFALIEPQWPEVRPAPSFERHNHLLAALERPVSIRFGVWRN
jgi:hypothetical protein